MTTTHINQQFTRDSDREAEEVMIAQRPETFLRITDRHGIVHAIAEQEDGTAKTICRGTYRTGKGGSRVWHFRSYGAENHKNCQVCFKKG